MCLAAHTMIRSHAMIARRHLSTWYHGSIQWELCHLLRCYLISICIFQAIFGVRKIRRSHEIQSQDSGITQLVKTQQDGGCCMGLLVRICIRWCGFERWIQLMMGTLQKQSVGGVRIFQTMEFRTAIRLWGQITC